MFSPPSTDCLAVIRACSLRRLRWEVVALVLAEVWREWSLKCVVKLMKLFGVVRTDVVVSIVPLVGLQLCLLRWRHIANSLLNSPPPLAPLRGNVARFMRYRSLYFGDSSFFAGLFYFRGNLQ